MGRPIAFASTGEKLDDFDQFHPDRMAERILGMGDVLSLIEQAERTMDKDVATKGAAAILEGRFTLEDFLEQLQQVRKMGSVSGIFSMLPGMPKDMKELSAAVDDRQIDQVEAIIHSMTPAERIDPTIIDGSRRVRIANGSGTATSDVNALLKQFKEMRKMMKGMGKGGGKGGLAGAMGGLGGMLGARAQAVARRASTRWPSWAPPVTWPGSPGRADGGFGRAGSGCPVPAGGTAAPPGDRPSRGARAGRKARAAAG